MILDSRTVVPVGFRTMAAIRAQVILHTTDAVPSNYVTNSWAFEVAAYPAQETDIMDQLDLFYSTLVPYLSPAIAQGGHQVKWSALPGVPPNYPYDETAFALATAPAGSALPSEVAVALSFQGARFAGLPQNRRRGRIYLGPLDSTANTSGRPTAALTLAMANAANDFGNNLVALTPPVNWSVWSHVDADVVNITDGWIDDAFDTVRRRGVETTSRQTFVA